MTVVSRLELNHPALGTAGGAGLHSSIEALYQKIGDNMQSRWFSIADFDQTETVDLQHNFEMDISLLRYDLWNYTGGEWVKVTASSTPSLADFAIVEKSGFEDTVLQITNNTGGDNLTFAVSLVNDPIYLKEGDVEDVDVTTVPPEDGQALVYESSSGKFKPGASGDSSFKLQSVSTPNATIKGGYLLLDNGKELATYDGAGSASTDFGGDLTVSLTTILGGAPADATAYYLYIDLNSLSAPVVQSDTGRSVHAVTISNFVLSTTIPTSMDLLRYVPRGVIKSATTGNAWSGAGSSFKTLAFLAGQTVDGTLKTFVRPQITQASHGFVANDLGAPLYINGSGVYVKAKADADSTSEIAGLIYSIIDANTFVLALFGEVSIGSNVSGALTVGSTYYLSSSTAGAITATEPTTVGYVSKPVGVAKTTSVLEFINMRGAIAGGVNARTNLTLANNSTNTVQNMSAYDAGEIAGFVSISATTSAKFYLQAQFAKNAAGTDYNVAYQTTGETPPSGFSVTITSGGVLQIVMPNVTGFTAANIVYALNAPAVGAAFPLSVNISSLVTSAAVTEYAANTKYGLKAYAHGGSYNGGNAPTVTLIGGGGSLSSVDYSAFIPYQIEDGTWRCKFNLVVSLSVISRTSIELAVAGITFKNIPTSGVGQAISGDCGTNATLGLTRAKNNNGNLETSFSSVTCGAGRFSGDVALESKPTWAY